MDKHRILVVYASSYGQTARIASRLSEHLRERGIEVDLRNAREARIHVEPGAFDGIVVAGSLIAKGMQPAVRQFVEDHLAILNETPSAFIQVSASAGSEREAGRLAADRIMHDFLATMNWRPRTVASIAGAINYTKYNILLRWYMKRASQKNGGSTDTSRDHEYTDWKQVERFASEVLQEFSLPRAATPGTPSLGDVLQGSATQ